MCEFRYRRGDDEKRRQRHSCARLHRFIRLHEGHKDHPILHQRRKQNGLTVMIVKGISQYYLGINKHDKTSRDSYTLL